MFTIPFRVLGPVLTALLSVQLPAGASKRAVDVGAHVWHPATHAGDLSGVPGSRSWHLARVSHMGSGA